ncbi:MAG: PH domain-containing protein [Microbacterium sp.]
MLFGSVTAAVLYLTTPGLWPGRWALLVLVPLIVMSVAEPPWRYAFTRVVVTEEHVRLRTGVVAPKERTMSWSDVTACDTRQSWAHRLLSVHAITLAQTGDERTRIQIPGVSNVDRDVIVGHFEARRPTTENEGAATELERVSESTDQRSELIYRARVGDLLVAGLSFGQFAVLGAAAVFTAVDLLDATGLTGGLERSFAVAPVLMVVAICCSALLLGFALMAIRFAGFEVRRDSDGTLEIAYGLLSLHRRRIDPLSVVGVVVQRNLIETLLGRVRLSVLTMDSSVQLGGNLLLPALPRRIVGDVVLRSFAEEGAAIGLTQRGRSAAFGQAGILAATLLPGGIAWWFGAQADARPWAVVLIALVAVIAAWLLGRLASSRLEVDDGARRVTHTMLHVTERRRVLTVGAVHAVSVTKLIGRPATAAVFYVAGLPHAARATRFTTAGMDLLAKSIAAPERRRPQRRC